MKSDNYLNLCLEQASLSPLRFRHGCIVVKGGKIIGQGYNDYRPGYDGGALKTGQLPKHASPVEHRKSRPKSKLNSAMEAPSTASSDFVPFETTNCNGGRYRTNQAFTMHSEMMAINSALGIPHLNLPGSIPQNSAFHAHVQQVCVAGQGQEVQPDTGSLPAAKWRFKSATYRCEQESE